MKTVCYARFSSTHQKEESITAQLRAIHEYATKNRLEIIKEYIDEAKSATTDDRPQFLQMIDDIDSGQIQVAYVLVHKLDRFARNRYDSAIYRHKLANRGVKLIAVAQPVDDSPEGVIMEALLEAMAEYYSRNLGREVQKGMRETALQARHTGGTPPLGYVVDPETKKYQVDEQEAQIVRAIFEMAASGDSYTTIIGHLNQSGYKTKLGKLFGKNSIHEILKNEKYTGVYIFNRSSAKNLGKRNHHSNKPLGEMVRIPDAIPQIISPDTWQRVQQAMAERKKTAPRLRGTAFYLLTGKIICGECGKTYTGNSQVAGRNKLRYHLYTCAGKKQKTCTNKSIRKEVLENYVLDEIENLFYRYRLEDMAQQLLRRFLERKQGNSTDLKQIQKSILEIGQKIGRLLEGVENGAIDASLAGPRINNLTREKEALEDKEKQLENHWQVTLTPQTILDYLKLNQQILGVRTDGPACKKIIDTYIETIVLGSEDIEVILKLPYADSIGGGGGN